MRYQWIFNVKKRSHYSDYLYTDYREIHNLHNSAGIFIRIYLPRNVWNVRYFNALKNVGESVYLPNVDWFPHQILYYTACSVPGLHVNTLITVRERAIQKM